MSDADRWRKLDIFQVIREKKVLFLLSSLALSSYQRKMGEKLGVEPGAELKEAILASRRVGAELVLVDRDIQATLKRTWANLSFFNKIKVLGGLFGGAFSDEELSEEMLEQMKEKDQLTEMMKEFARVMPQVKTPLIDERDQFLISAINDAPGRKVVAVVGAGHVEGMLVHKDTSVNREELSEIPPPSRSLSWIKWLIVAVILGAFALGFARQSGENIEQMIWDWVIPNSVMAGLLALVAGAKPLSVLVATIASPITSLNPMLGAGMVVGFVEAWLRKPTVADAESLPLDVMSLSGVYKNPFSRVLLVAFLTNIGSSLGAYVAVPLVLRTAFG